MKGGKKLQIRLWRILDLFGDRGGKRQRAAICGSCHWMQSPWQHGAPAAKSWDDGLCPAHAHSHTTHTSNRRTWFMSKDNCTIFFIYPTQKSVEYITMLLRSKIKKQQKIHIFLSFTTTSLIFYIIFLFLLHISVCMPLFFRWIQFSFSWELPVEDDLSNMLLPAPRLCVWDKKQWISFLWKWVIIS